MTKTQEQEQAYQDGRDAESDSLTDPYTDALENWRHGIEGRTDKWISAELEPEWNRGWRDSHVLLLTDPQSAKALLSVVLPYTKRPAAVGGPLFPSDWAEEIAERLETALDAGSG